MLQGLKGGRSHLTRGTLLLILALVALLGVRADSVSVQRLTFTLTDGSQATLSFAAEPAASDFRLEASAPDHQTWSSPEYRLDLIVRQDAGGACLVSVALQSNDGNPFILKQYGLSVDTSYSGQEGVWSYNDPAWSDFVNTHLETPYSVTASANSGIPFVADVDTGGLNRLALGTLGQSRLVQLQGTLQDDGETYTLSAQETETFTESRHQETFYVSRASRTWFETAQYYTLAVDFARGYTPLPTPETIFNPTFDSWYFTGDGVDQQLIWQLAQITQQLGFGAYLLDAGWDTVPGQYSLGLDGSTGDYTPAPQYFPNFPALLAQIKYQLGMRVMLWMQQYALGRQSIYYPELKDSLYQMLDPLSGVLVEDPALCPRVAETRLHMQQLFDNVMSDYHPDALWFDWQDQLPLQCQSPHAHDMPYFGDAYNLTQQMIQDTVTKHNPDTFVEMRWPFANLNNKLYSQLWQPLDSANNFENMRLQALKMRAFSRGVYIGTDEMYWSPDLPDEEAARFMATVVFTGIPYFGPNLLKESPRRLEMLNAWLQFYESNKAGLTQGRFEPYGDRLHPDQKIIGSGTTYIYYGNRHAGPVESDSRSTRICIVNASATPGLDLSLSGVTSGWYKATISDLLLNPDVTLQPVHLSSSPHLQYDVPVGCILTLKSFRPEMN